MVSACISRRAPRTAPGARGPPQDRTRDGGRARAVPAAVRGRCGARLDGLVPDQLVLDLGDVGAGDVQRRHADGLVGGRAPARAKMVPLLRTVGQKVCSRAFGRHWDGDGTTASVHGRLQEAGGTRSVAGGPDGAGDRRPARGPSPRCGVRGESHAWWHHARSSWRTASARAWSYPILCVIARGLLWTTDESCWHHAGRFSVSLKTATRSAGGASATRAGRSVAARSERDGRQQFQLATDGGPQRDADRGQVESDRAAPRCLVRAPRRRAASVASLSRTHRSSRSTGVERLPVPSQHLVVHMERVERRLETPCRRGRRQRPAAGTAARRRRTQRRRRPRHRGPIR